MKHTAIKLGLLAATSMSAAWAAPAWSQERSAFNDADAIVVTARRVEERLQDVPISITVFNQEQIDNRNVTTATDLAVYTPSLTSNNRFGPDKASFVIRGFSQLETTSPTVGVYFADVVAPRAIAGTASGNGAGPGSFFDLQNVQILKGPQGTLFGRNTTGGAILLVPTKPTGNLEGYVEGSIGNYDLRRVQAVLNVPLSDTFKVRMGVDRQKRDGYLRNQSGIGPKDFGDSDYISARLSIVADLTPDLENYTIARYTHSDTNGIMFRMIGCVRDPAERTGRGIVFAQPACDQIDRQNARGDGFYDVENIVPDPFNVTDEWQVINTTTWTVNDALTIKNIVSYGEFWERFHQNIGGENLVLGDPSKPFASTLIRNLKGKYGAAQSTFTEELQFQGLALDGKFQWQGGGYFESSKPLSGGNTTYSIGGVHCTDVTELQCEAIIPQAFGPAVGLVQNEIEFRNIGFYAQGTYQFSPQFAITAGIRYTMDRSVGRGGRTTASFLTPNNPQGVCTRPEMSTVVTLDPRDCYSADFVEKSEEPTWVVDLEYKPIPDVMLYAKWARGYRQGGVNPSNIGLETWRPEKIDAYEIGAKTSFSGAVSGYFNITGFYNDLTDQQLSAIAIGKPTSGIPGARIIVNAGKSRVYGVEVDASVSLFEGFKLDAAYSYLNTKLQDFASPTLSPDSPFAMIVPQVTGGALPLSPKHRVTTTASYTLPLDESIGRVSFGATYTHTTSQIASDTSPFGVVPASDLLNLNFNWNSVAGGPFDLAAFVTNLTKEKFAVNVANNWSSNGYESVVTNVPRMYGVRLKYRFGQ